MNHRHIATSDEGLARALRTLFDAIDPVPAHVRHSAVGSYAWRTVDTELARLVADSAGQLAAVRGAQHARLVSFEATDLTVEVEVAETGTTRQLLGQLVPPGPGEVQILTPGATTTVSADALGRFRAEDVAAGPVGLAVTRSGGDHVVATMWITI